MSDKTRDGGKIVSLVPKQDAPGADKEPVADIVNMLRTLLEEAERGELRGIGFASVASNGQFSTAFVGGSNTSYALSAGINCLNHRFSATLLSEAE